MSWRLAKSLEQLRSQVNQKFPNRSKLSDGTIGDAAHASRDSDHNPWVKDGAMGVVTALDLTHDPKNGCDGTELAQALVQSQDPRIKYLIWNRQIVSSVVKPWVWRPYRGSNPHTKHVHISVRDTKARYDATDDWQIG